MLAGFQVEVVAYNLAIVVDVRSLCALGAGEVERCELSLEQQEAPIVSGAGSERAHDSALVIDPERGTGNRSGDVQGGEIALRRGSNAEAKNDA